MAEFKRTNSEQIYKGKAFTIRLDTVRMPDGRETKWDVVEHVGSVSMVPVDSDGNIVFVRQYRHAAGLEVLELPAGTLHGGEPPEICAARELREEIGMEAASLDRLASFYLAPGYSNEFMHSFLATDLRPNPLPADEDEFLQVVRIPAREAMQMAERGEIQDAKSLAALLLARPHLLKYLED